jgi:hydrogenase/urease accessory protein HupE
MNMRLSAVLFIGLFFIGAFPALFVRPLGSASAGLTEGFLLPAADIYRVAETIAIGFLCAWLGAEAVLILPLSTLLMLVIGALTEINAHTYQAVHQFILGAIILFAMSVSIPRNKFLLLYIAPIAVWAYFSGASFMQHIPSITTPMFFMIGNVISVALMLAIGMTLGLIMADKAHASIRKLKNSGTLSTLTSLF